MSRHAFHSKGILGVGIGVLVVERVKLFGVANIKYTHNLPFKGSGIYRDGKILEYLTIPDYFNYYSSLPILNS